MADLKIRPHAPDADGRVLDITPESAGWRYVGFSVHHCKEGQGFRHSLKDRETCLVILSGRAAVKVDDMDFGVIGERNSVFDDVAPYAVYAPADALCDVKAVTDLEVAICTAPGWSKLEPRLIEPSAIGMDERGSGSNTRFVRNVLPETEPADSLLIAEVITPSGNWSSYPPHKHDSDDVPSESALEETYYYRMNPVQGFGFQRVYTDDRSIDEAVCVEDGDVVMVPKGYHPVGSPHGYDMYYLNVMAGPKRTWLIHNDPAHEWIVKR